MPQLRNVKKQGFEHQLTLRDRACLPFWMVCGKIGATGKLTGDLFETQAGAHEKTGCPASLNSFTLPEIVRAEAPCGVLKLVRRGL